MSTDLLWTGSESSAFDQFAQTVLGIPSAQLMENAGQASARLAASILDSHLSAADAPILCLIGPGNNGGDGLVAARALHRASPREVVIWAPLGCSAAPDSAAGMALQAARALKLEIHLSTTPPPLLHRPALALDALFGIGLKRPLDGTAAASIEFLRELDCPILALDLPSGLHVDSGAILGVAAAATSTLSFIGWKQGLTRGAGPQVAGEVYLGAIGLSHAYAQEWLIERRSGQPTDGS